MSRAPIFTAAAYGLWVLICILITVVPIGDGGVNAHLALLFTGPPASLFSLYLSHGSLFGVVAAGVLGLAQWVSVAYVASHWSSRRSENHGA